MTKERNDLLTPELLRQTHPRLRVDLMRKGLRSGRLVAAGVTGQLDDWISLFDQSYDPALMVLILELLSEVEDEAVVELARRASNHRADGVRLEGLKILLDRHPLETLQESKRHGEDYSLEVRLLVAERVAAYDRRRSVELCFSILEDESGGDRMMHALERVCGHLVELGGADLVGRLKGIQEEFGDEDVEGFLAWALEQLEEDGDA